MDDTTINRRINELAAEEHELFERNQGARMRRHGMGSNRWR
jgi:hypothetical protein